MKPYERMTLPEADLEAARLREIIAGCNALIITHGRNRQRRAVLTKMAAERDLSRLNAITARLRQFAHVLPREMVQWDHDDPVAMLTALYAVVQKRASTGGFELSPTEQQLKDAVRSFLQTHRYENGPTKYEDEPETTESRTTQPSLSSSMKETDR